MKKYNSTMNYEIRLQEFMADAKERKDRECFRKIMKSPEGRWFFMRVLEITGYHGRSFTGNSETYFREGMREVGIQLDRRLVDLLGLEGFELKQKAEKENIDFQYQQKRYFDKEENNGPEQ